jgi:hypothetical protein
MHRVAHRIASAAAASIAMITTLAGCPSREVSLLPINDERQEKTTIDVVVERDLDILFIVDDSESMKDEQNSLAANFPLFIDTLEQIQGGLPNVHIGVISTNMGANPAIPNCAPGDSDEGRLQAAFVNDPANFPQCQDGTLSLDNGATYISDVLDPDTNQRVTNYDGDLAGVFSCMAVLGIEGCGFEMQLESMRAALTEGVNGDFLRDDAYLAVIFITDEDDCSASDLAMFDVTMTGDTSFFGPLDSFRCFEFGVQCTPDNARVLGEKTECKPREDSEYMYPVQEYVDFLKTLKSDPRKVIVAGIIGYDEMNPDEPLEVIRETKPIGEVFSLVPACQVLDTDGVTVKAKATPGVRLRSFLEQFPTRNTVTTICQDNLAGALQIISDLLRDSLEDNPYCLTADVFIYRNAPDRELKYDCQVSDVLYGEETALPHCETPSQDSPNKPCWYIQENSDGCNSGPLQEVVVVRPDNVAVNSDTDVVVRCAVN